MLTDGLMALMTAMVQTDGARWSQANDDDDYDGVGDDGGFDLGMYDETVAAATDNDGGGGGGAGAECWRWRWRWRWGWGWC